MCHRHRGRWIKQRLYSRASGAAELLGLAPWLIATHLPIASDPTTSRFKRKETSGCPSAGNPALEAARLADLRHRDPLPDQHTAAAQCKA